MCVPGSRMWQLRINWLNVFIHAAFVLLSVLLLGQQYYDFEWRMEVIREGSEHHNTSWNLTLTLGTFSESCLMGSVLSLPSGAATPRMPPTLHLTSSLSGGSPKKKRKKMSNTQRLAIATGIGLCQTPRCRTPARSGCKGYCWSCFKLNFPEEHDEKCKKRKRACVACGEADELRLGFCKRCLAARRCHVCKDINCDGDALLCISCQKKHNDTEVKSFKLALWCRTCNSAEELSRGLCWNCSRHTCDQCGTSTGVLPTEFSCSKTSCRAKLH